MTETRPSGPQVGPYTSLGHREPVWLEALIRETRPVWDATDHSPWRTFTGTGDFYAWCLEHRWDTFGTMDEVRVAVGEHLDPSP